MWSDGVLYTFFDVGAMLFYKLASNFRFKMPFFLLLKFKKVENNDVSLQLNLLNHVKRMSVIPKRYRIQRKPLSFALQSDFHDNFAHS